MHKDDDQWRRCWPLVFRTTLRHSAFPAARGYRLRAASASVATRRCHHAGSTIGTRRSILATFTGQMDVIVVSLSHGRRTKHRQDKRENQQLLHLFTLIYLSVECKLSIGHAHDPLDMELSNDAS